MLKIHCSEALLKGPGSSQTTSIRTAYPNMTLPAFKFWEGDSLDPTYGSRLIVGNLPIRNGRNGRLAIKWHGGHRPDANLQTSSRIVEISRRQICCCIKRPSRVFVFFPFLCSSSTMDSASRGNHAGAVAVSCLRGSPVFSSDGSRSSIIRVDSDSVSYTVLDKIGAGALGTVYAAERSPDGEKVSGIPSTQCNKAFVILRAKKHPEGQFVFFQGFSSCVNLSCIHWVSSLVSVGSSNIFYATFLSFNSLTCLFSWLHLTFLFRE